MQQPEGLISVLLDKTACIDERDDAAMDLGAYDDNRVLTALLSIVLDSKAESFIMDTCGESIAEIWVKRNYFDIDIYKKIAPAARHELYRYIKRAKPEWIDIYNLKNII